MSAPKSKLSMMKSDHPLLRTDWTFMEDCGLSQVVDVLAHALQQQDIRMQGPTAGNEVYRNIQYLELMEQDPRYTSLFGRLDTMGTKLYTKAHEQVTTLKTEITQYVEKLAGLIRKERNEILAKSGIDSVVGEQRKPIPLNRMKWEGIEQAGGMSFLTHKVSEYTNLPIEKVSTATLKYVSAKWRPDLAITPKVSDQDKDTLYRAYVKLQPQASKERFLTLLDSVTNNHSYRILLGDTRRGWNHRMYMDTVKYFNSIIPELVALHSVLSSHMDGMMSNDVSDKFQKNLDSIQLLYMSMAMYLHHHREHTYSKSVILDADTVNEDTFEEIEDGTVSTTDEDTGETDVLDEEDVMKYVRVHHVFKKVRVPNTGVSLNQILQHRKFTENKLAEYTKELNSRLKSVHGQATSAAMSRILGEVITHRFTSVDVANTYRGMLPKYLGMVQEQRHSIEEVLYRYFLETDYKDTQLSKVYHQYKYEVDQIVAATESSSVELTSDIQNNIEQKIVINLSVDFLKSLIS